MLYGAVYISPGTRVKANFGEEKFLFDMERLEDAVKQGRGEKIVFCPDEVSEGWHSDVLMNNPDKRYIG